MIRSEIKNGEVIVETSGTNEDLILETSAIIGGLIGEAINFDAEDGKDIAKATLYEIICRVQAFVERKYGFDIMDVDREFCDMVREHIIERENKGETE